MSLSPIILASLIILLVGTIIFVVVMRIPTVEGDDQNHCDKKSGNVEE